MRLLLLTVLALLAAGVGLPLAAGADVIPALRIVVNAASRRSVQPLSLLSC